MRYHIGKFNDLPLFFTQKFDKKTGTQAYFSYYKFTKYRKEEKRVKSPLITVTPIFFKYPLKTQILILWHEYGHYKIKFNKSKYSNNQSIRSIIDAFAEYYAYCICKFNFNEYIDILFNRKVDPNENTFVYERHYNELKNNNYDAITLPEHLNNIASLLYFFDKNKKILNLFYEYIHTNYSFKNNKFEWDNFIKPIEGSKDFDRDKEIENLENINKIYFDEYKDKANRHITKLHKKSLLQL